MRVTRHWHRCGRLWWYLGNNPTDSHVQRWHWFRTPTGFAGNGHARLGPLHLVWHERPERR